MNNPPSSPPEAGLGPQAEPLGPETVESLQELGEVFRQIHRRLVAEGYVIRDGKILKPGAGNPPS